MTRPPREYGYSTPLVAFASEGHSLVPWGTLPDFVVAVALDPSGRITALDFALSGP